MNDKQKLKELVERGGDRRDWKTRTRKAVYYAGLELMMHFGGFDALCLAEPEELQAWLDGRPSGRCTAYSMKLRMCHVYDFLVDEGAIGANPARALKIAVPGWNDRFKRPPMDMKDVRKLLAIAKRESFTLQGSKTYLILCLRLRCGLRYAPMSRCRMSDLRLCDSGGSLVAYDSRRRRQVLYRIDSVTADAVRNYLDLRGSYGEDEPLIAKSVRRGRESGGFYRDGVLQNRVRSLCEGIGIHLKDYSLDKTVVMLAYAEGADIVQATNVAAAESLMLAAKVADELDGADPAELRRRLLGEIDSKEDLASGLMRSEDIVDAVSVAYRIPSLRVVIGADGWARFELPKNDADQAEKS